MSRGERPSNQRKKIKLKSSHSEYLGQKNKKSKHPSKFKRTPQEEFDRNVIEKKTNHRKGNHRKPLIGNAHPSGSRRGKTNAGRPIHGKAIDGEAIEGEAIDGTVKRHPDGFGFLIPDDRSHADVYIPRHSMAGVMTNDKVRARVTKATPPDRLSGEIIEITNHAATQVVGKFQTISKTMGIILDDEHIWGADLKVRLSPGIEPPKNGDLVVVKIESYPGTTEGFIGQLINSLGDSQDPLTDTRRVIYQHHIPMEFSPKTISESRALSLDVPTTKLGRRLDLRGKGFVTIDGANAKDFDDAIYVEAQPDGFKLWVAIADVSHYVKFNSSLDKDAFARGNSTYFPHFVVPMLPEALSNELCSLKPHVPRFALTAELLISHSGQVKEKKFYESLIQSQHRVTYGEAQDLLDCAVGDEPPPLKSCSSMIRVAAQLAKILMKKRFAEGSLDLDIPETQVLIDDAGNPTDIIRTERLFSHRLIEELMLAANVAVATYFKEKKINGIYRIHDQPALEALEMLENFMRVFGGSSKNLSGGKLQKKITDTLRNQRGLPHGQILHILTLRSMKQAEYSSQNIGHFGLGFENYTHFTSPIRRYADLLVHRTLKGIIYREQPLPKKEDLATAGTHLSACEQRSVKAERQFVSIKKARFMVKHLGQVFGGIISSVTRFGVFVLLRDYDVDGLVKLEALGEDRWEFQEETLQLVGKRTRRSFKIGDEIRIQVTACDTENGQLDFVLSKGD